MQAKGFFTQNAYYEEQHIDYYLRSDPSDRFKINVDLKACGAKFHEDGVCSFYPFAFRSQVSSISHCMQRKGYEISLPRYKSGVRIYERRQEVSKNFCLSLTPQNRLGGVSLGKFRIE